MGQQVLSRSARIEVECFGVEDAQSMAEQLESAGFGVLVISATRVTATPPAGDHVSIALDPPAGRPHRTVRMWSTP